MDARSPQLFPVMSLDLMITLTCKMVMSFQVKLLMDKIIKNKPEVLSAIKVRVKPFNTLRKKIENLFNEANWSFC